MRFPGVIYVGGKLSASDLGALCEAASDDRAGLDWDEPAPTPADLLLRAPGPLVLKAALARYGRLSSLEAFCQRHGLTYRSFASPFDDFDGELVGWEPGLGSSSTCLATHEEEPTIGLSELRFWLAQGMSLRQVVDWVAWFDPAKVPAFEIVSVK